MLKCIEVFCLFQVFRFRGSISLPPGLPAIFLKGQILFVFELPPKKQMLLVVWRQKNLVSCRERWTLFNGNYLSGAILMAADNVGNLRSPIRQVEG